MTVPNVHTQRHVRTRRELFRMVMAYRLPLVILTSALALAIGYNLFFIAVFQGSSRVYYLTKLLQNTLDVYHAEVFWLNYPSTRSFAVVALCVGDILFALMFSSFLRATFTCAGYVPPEPWRWPPKADAERQRTLREIWARQQEWIKKQETRARQQVVFAQQYLQQQQQLWCAIQLSYVQQQRQLQQVFNTGESQPLAPLPFSSVSPLTFAGSVSVQSVDAAPCLGLAAQYPPGAVIQSESETLVSMQQSRTVDFAPPNQQGSLGVQPVIKSCDTSVFDRRNIGVDSTGTFLTLKSDDAHGEPSDAEGDTDTSSGSATSSSRLSLVTPQAGPPLSSSISSSHSNNTSTSLCATAATSSLFGEETSENTNAVAVVLNTPSKREICTPPHDPATATAIAVTTGDAPLNRVAVREYEADGSLRFCNTCHQYKPDGSHHCRICQRCVFDMDHHCFFLNNCVGRHNYKYFFLCIFYSTLCGTVNSTLFVFAYVGSAVCSEWGNNWWWVPAGMSSIGAGVTYLWVQHVFLLLRGVSTLDRMAQLKSERFLETFSGGYALASRRSNCHDDCCLTVWTCVAAARQAARRALPLATGADRRQVSYRGSSVHLPFINSVDATLAQSERRARRLELLFGRPQHLWEYLFPIAPHPDACLPDEKASNLVHVEVV